MGLVTPGIGLVFWTTLAFLIVLFLLGKFAWKPILSSIKEREDSIEGSLGSRSSIKKQVQRGRAKLGTKQLTTEERKKLALEGRKLLEAARAKRKKVVGPPSSITTNNTKS